MLHKIYKYLKIYFKIICSRFTVKRVEGIRNTNIHQVSTNVYKNYESQRS